VPHDRSAIRNALHHPEVVAYEQDSQTVTLTQPVEKLEHLRADRHVKRGYGLIADKEARAGRQRARDGGTLQLPSRKLVGSPRPKCGIKPYALEKPLGRPAKRTSLQPAQAAERMGKGPGDRLARVEAHFGPEYQVAEPKPDSA